MADAVLVLSDERMIEHDPGAGAGHPERPQRLRSILDDLRLRPIEGVSLAKPQAATREQIERVHEPSYVDAIDAMRGQTARLDEDTAVSPASVGAAYLAAGAAIGAVEAILPSPHGRGVGGEGNRRAFALVRPPGHHAERALAMGFCLFNNVAVAAAHAIEHLGCKRVLIIDWDVHHGNGTQHIFEDRRDVLFVSSHQWPLWPGTGAANEVGHGDGQGFTVNIPLPRGADDALILSAYREVVEPIADAYKPDLVLVSAGFDAHRDDPLAELQMTDDGFAAMCGLVRGIADRHCDGRIALMLEGGYNLNALTAGVHRCLEVLAGVAKPPQIAERTSHGGELIDQLRAIHRRYWAI